MLVAAAKELAPGERRVAITPASTIRMIKRGLSVLIQSGLGEHAGFNDDDYQQAGARIADSRDEVFKAADALFAVRCPPAAARHADQDLSRLQKGQLLLGHCDPLMSAEANKALAATGASVFAVEIIPRTTRAQAMDALSSQANLAGYKAVLLAANQLRKIFPMLMTAAGTLQAARVFVIGAGVAGLQAIATAKRLGAVVSAFDVRTAVKDQVASLGAKFVEIEVATADGAGGYAREQSADQLARQQELMARVVAESDVVITTAAIPGKRAPQLVNETMVKAMRRGSVLVDLAAESGGNCELTQRDQIIERHGVTIIGTANIPSLIPWDASLMYANNLLKLLEHTLDKQNNLKLDLTDEIIAGCLVCHNGEVIHPQVRKILGMSERAVPSPA